MSGEVRGTIAVLERRFKAAGKKLNISIIFMITGVVTIVYVPVAGLGAYWETGDRLSWSWAPLVLPMASGMLFGLALFVFGLCVFYYYRHLLGVLERERYSRGYGAMPGKEKLDIQSYLNEQQRSLTVALRKPKCPNCGNVIPQGNFEFCPFCGNSLKS